MVHYWGEAGEVIALPRYRGSISGPDAAGWANYVREMRPRNTHTRSTT